MNFWQDGSLKDAGFYTDLFKRIRSDWPDYRIVLVYVTASEAVIRQRAHRRGVSSGRVVPDDVLTQSLQATEAAFNKVAHLAHAGLVIDNGDDAGTPVLLRAFSGQAP